MKVKLLKKVRKRFSIVHLPGGFILDNHHFDYDLYKLIDSDDCEGYRDEYVQLWKEGDKKFDIRPSLTTEKECISYLTAIIITRLRFEGHRQSKDKVIRTSYRKVWYNA